eukprot:5661-Heterococcus_DN1.PRE.3
MSGVQQVCDLLPWRLRSHVLNHESTANSRVVNRGQYVGIRLLHLRARSVIRLWTKPRQVSVMLGLVGFARFGSRRQIDAATSIFTTCATTDILQSF